MLPNEIISRLASLIDISINVRYIVSVNLGDESIVLRVEDIKYARVGKKAYEDGNTYTITEVDDKNVTLKLLSGTFNDSIQTFDLEEPLFMYGSVIMVNGEISRIRNTHKKTPLIYLAEYPNVNYNDAVLDRIEYEVNTRLFFLDEANFDDWTTDEYTPLVVRPMKALKDLFVDVVNRNSQTVQYKFDRGSERQVNKFANFDRNGNIKKLFNDDLSGLEFDFPLKVVKNCNNYKLF